MNEYLIMADALVDNAIMTAEVTAENETEALWEGITALTSKYGHVFDNGSYDSVPIYGGAWSDPMNSCMFKVLSRLDGYEICQENGKDYETGRFALRVTK